MKWRVLTEQKSSRGKFWAASSVEKFLRKMWERFTNKKVWARTLFGRWTQLETDDSWQYESPCKEEVEPLRHSNDLRFDGSVMRKNLQRWEVRRLGKVLGK